jgi:hypothetical protein
VALTLATCTLAAWSADERLELAFDPPVLRLQPGESRLVALVARGIPDSGLAAFQVTLAYDPRLVRVVDPNAAFVGSGVPTFAPLGGSPLCAQIRRTLDCPDAPWMLTATGRQPFGTSRFDAEAGKVTVAFGTAGESAPPIGDGTLAVFEVIGVAGARSALRLEQAILADRSDPPRVYAIELPDARPRREDETPRRGGTRDSQ